MAKLEAIQEQLKQFRYAANTEDVDLDDDDEAPSLMNDRYGAAIKKLPAALKGLAFYLMNCDEKGVALPQQWRAKESEKKLLETLAEKMPAQFDKLSAADRQKVFAVFCPQLAGTLETAWQWLKRQTYSIGYYRKSFRVPQQASATLEGRWQWLQSFIRVSAQFKAECFTPAWLAAWSKHAFSYQEEVSRPVLVAAMNTKGKEGDEVFNILCQTVTREHPTAIMGELVISSLLASDRQAGWELMEKTLLAAQRQEGLRQWITQNMDFAHPEAFVRLLRLIVDKDLLRFSSVARSVNIWLGLLWDSVSVKVLSQNVEAILKFLESPAERKTALASSDPETVYRALWASATEDAMVTIDQAKKLLNHKSDEIRYVAVWILTQIGLPEAAKVKAALLDDSNLHVALMAAVALKGLTVDPEFSRVASGVDDDDDDDDDGKRSGSSAYFDALERLYQRLPEKPQTLKAIVWPWTERKIERAMVTGCLLSNLGDLPPTRMLPYLKGLNSWQQRGVIQLLAAQKKWDALTRSSLFDLLGHASSDVREVAFDSLKKEQLKDDEWQKVEGYLSRTAADLRRSCLEMICRAKDPQVLQSAERLLSAGDRPTRLAGLELCRQLAVGNRCRSKVKELAAQYQGRQKKLVAEEETQLKAIAESDREVLTLANGLGLFKPEARSKIITPKAKKVPLITKAALACIESLDAFVNEKQKTSVRVKTYRGFEDKLLGEMSSYEFPTIYAHKPLGPQLAKFPLIEMWQEWWAKRPAKCKDKDGLELLRAASIVKLLDSWRFEQARKQAKKKPEIGRAVTQIVGEIELGKTNHLSTTGEILEALYLSQIPAGALDYLLDCAENNLACLTESILQTSIPDPKDAEQTKGRRVYRYVDDDDEDGEADWRENELLIFWVNTLDGYQNQTNAKLTDAQFKRYWELKRFFDEPLPGSARRRPDLEVILRAFKLGYATRDDVLDALIGPQFGYGSFRELAQLTERNRSADVQKLFDADKRLAGIVEEVREKLYETELARGETSTVSSSAALALGSLFGTDRLFKTLATLQKNTFRIERGYSKSTEDNRISTLTQLAKMNYPAEGDTVEGFRKHVQAATAAGYCSEERLLELAFLAPQWTKMVEATLNWKGFGEGLYWFLAHMRTWGADGTEAAAEAEGLESDAVDDMDDSDDDDDVDDEGSGETPSKDSIAKPQRLTAWERLILERTPLTDQERSDGAVDVAWFERMFKELGDKRFMAMANAAKLAANAAQAKKAQFLADVLRGQTKRQELVDGIDKRKLKDYVRLIGLLPLATGAKRESDLQERYKVLQGYKKYARGLSSLTKPSAMRAVEVGMQNLARLAGYPDPLRMEWALEAESIKDLAAGPVSITKDGVTVTLQLDSDAKPQISVRKGDKPIKSVPAPLKKKHASIAELTDRAAELKRSASRMRQSLESAMCRGDTFTGAELVQLSNHAILAPQLNRLVLLGDGIAGYPDKGGKVLRDHAGKLEPVKKDELLRIAHPADLLERGDWDKWQHDCFTAERVQPFKQVFRELYVVTKQEKKDQTASHRFTGQQISPRQAMALWNSRGWNTQDEVFKIFHDLSLIAEVSFQYTYGTAAEIEGLTIEAVQFRKRDDYKPCKLSSISPIVFSEIMRDMDLVVSVAHRGEVDPEASASTVEMRAALLRETTRLLGLKNVSFKPTHAIIKGYYGEYSIHLGSAIAHRLPGGALNILPVHAQHRGRIFLPFADDDPRTAELISKVLLLARDEEILDPSILDQIAAPVAKRPVQVKAPTTSVTTPGKATKSGAKAAATSSSAGTAGKRHFEFVEGSSNKFWEIELDGDTVTTTWGKIGTTGQSKAKKLADAAKAKAEYDKLIAEKTGKGYTES